jgi:hypothetical protein
MIDFTEKIGKRLFNAVLICAVLILALTQLKSCGLQARLTQLQKENKQLLLYGQQMSERINEQGEKISVQKAKYLSEKSKNETLLEKITKLEDTISEFTVTTKTIVDSIEIPVERIDTVYLNNSVLVNYHYVKNDENLYLSATSNRNELLIDTLSFYNTTTVAHKWERRNIFAKKQYIIQVNNSSPYIQTVGMSNYTFVEEKKWHEKRGVLISIGVLAGIIGTNL